MNNENPNCHHNHTQAKASQNPRWVWVRCITCGHGWSVRR